MPYLLGPTVSVKCVCVVGTLSSTTPFVSEVVHSLPMRELAPFIHNIYLLHACLCFYVTLCNPVQFILFFPLSVQHESWCTGFVELYIISPSARAAGCSGKQEDRSSCEVLPQRTSTSPALPQSPRESRCCKSQLDSKAP